MYTKCTDQWTDWLLASPGRPWVWYVALNVEFDWELMKLWANRHWLFAGPECNWSPWLRESNSGRILEFGWEFMKLWASRRCRAKFGRPSVHQVHQPMNRLVFCRPGVWFVALDSGNPTVVEFRKSVQNSWSYERTDIFMQNSEDRVCTKCTNQWTDWFSADPECDL